MDKTKTTIGDRSDATVAATTAAGKVLQLPGGLVYHHDLQHIDAGKEGANLLDLQSRQDAVPVFSKKAKSVMVFF